MSERICIIPVRAGSKGVPHKNIRPFCGKPLLAHSVAQAHASGCFAEIVVSSDSLEYLEIARQAGATQLVHRPDELASDIAGSMDVLFHALAEVERETGRSFETVTLLQATSPLRLPDHISAAVEQLESSTDDVVLSVSEAKNSPYFNLLEYDPKRQSYGLSKTLDTSVTRRQDAPDVMQMNGSIYVWARRALMQQKRVMCDAIGVYLMPPLYSVDIDTEIDWAFAELAQQLITAQNSPPKDAS